MVRKFKVIKRKPVYMSPEPNWKDLTSAKDEETRATAWKECDYFVHNEITTKEYVHSTRKWIKEKAAWGKDVYEDVLKIPDVFLSGIGKHGWKAVKLGYMPASVDTVFKKHILDLVQRVDTLRSHMPYESPIHESIADLKEDNPLNPTNVKAWIEVWKGVASAFNKDDCSNDALTARHYVANMVTYLKNGVWLDSRFGERRESKTVAVCIALSYDSKGIVKRTKGVFYPDLGVTWETN